MTDIYFLDLARNMLHKAIGSLLDVQVEIDRLIEKDNEDEITIEEDHKQKHKAFDELVMDYVQHSEKMLDDNTTVLELLSWSYERTK